MFSYFAQVLFLPHQQQNNCSATTTTRRLLVFYRNRGNKMTITESSNKDTEAAIDNIVADTAVVKAETSGAEADEEAEDFAISKGGDDSAF